jgi:YceI-like domain
MKTVSNQLSREMLVGPWELDPQRSSVEFRAGHFWGLATVRGHFDDYTGRLELEAQLREVAEGLEIEAATGAAHRELGMTWSPLGMIPSRSELRVTGRLKPPTE